MNAAMASSRIKPWVGILKIRVQPFCVRDGFVRIDWSLQLLETQLLSALEDDGAFQFMRQFTNVARP